MFVEHWLAFAAASALLLLLPGPTVLMVISHALAHGRRSAAATVAGVVLGDFTAMTASLVGLGAALQASSSLFTLLRWVGAIYLVFLGVRLWRAPLGEPKLEADAATTPRRMLMHAYAVTSLNPKTIVFFIAFVPQFLARSYPPFPQLAVFEATFVTLAGVNALFYALTASAARQTIQKPRVQRTVNRAGGTLLVGAGALAAFWRGSSA